ncbi:MAG: Do family serine endopeptidase [Balneolaceae bacterium]
MNNTYRSVFVTVFLAVLYFGFTFVIDYGSDEASPEVQSPQYQSKSAIQVSDTASTPSLQGFNDAIVNIADRTNPTVVTITTRQTVRVRQRSPFSLFFDDPRFDREREFQREGLGSGVIVSSDGYIITNNHVIEGADEINVRMYDGEEVETEVIGTDPATDVAILKVNRNDLPAIPLGDSDQLRVGELVLAIGSPLNQQFAHTVSMGIVSAKGREGLGLTSYENYIQTDAAINPGNSGGALINSEGQLIGINTAIASRSGGNQGIGFAIPVNMAKMVMESILEDGRVIRGYLGITQGGMVDEVMARALELDENFGVVIGSVQPDGPADEAGLREGDVILRKDGEPIRDWSAFRMNIANSEPGSDVELEVFRDGERLSVTVTLDEFPTDETVASVPDDQRQGLEDQLGFRVEDLTDEIRSQLNLDTRVDGAVVTDIQRGSGAYRQGLRQGDVITQVQNQPVTGSDEFYSAMESLISAGRDVALLRITRGSQNMFVAFEIR